MRTVEAIQAEIDAKRKEVGGLFDACDGKLEKMTTEQSASIRTLNGELETLTTERGESQKMEEIKAEQEKAAAAAAVATRTIKHAGGEGSQPGEGEQDYEPWSGKSIGRLWTESQSHKAYVEGGQMGVKTEVPLRSILSKAARFKSILGEDDSLAGVDTQYGIQNIRLAQIIEGLIKPATISDLFPSGTTTGNAVVYMEETTTTNAAAEVAEGAAKPESALDFTERTVPVRVIATLLPVTRQLMEDAPALESYINNRLRTFLEDRLDTQLLVGNGVAPNIEGVHNVTGIGAQAKGGDTDLEAIHKAITNVRVNAFREPGNLVMHPTDWEAIRLLQDAAGNYIMGPPSQSGPLTIWGLPVTVTTAETVTQALVGDFRFGAQTFLRSGVEIAVSDSHSDYFSKNLLAIRAEFRIAFPAFRPAAFCEITGL